MKYQKKEVGNLFQFILLYLLYLFYLQNFYAISSIQFNTNSTYF